MIYRFGERKPRVAADSYVAPGAVVIGDVELGPQTSIWFGAVLRGDVEQITLSRGVNVQDGSVLHTDPGAPMLLEEMVTIGHKVVLHGCRIGQNSLVGIGAVVLNHAVIGANSLVGAGALVTERKTFPEGVLILGSPARVARDLTDEEIARLPKTAERSIARAALYRDALSEA
jgi:carbonic anhydrase/acetyltransferase-like protein (isoleucine patch superfamily)